MSALPDVHTRPVPEIHDQFIVTSGKSGAVGVFTSDEPLKLRRGQRVIIQTQRGIEIGSVLCPASLRQARILGATSSGALLRCVTSEDESHHTELATLEQSVFETSRAWAARDALDLEILDVELLFDAKQAIIQFVGVETPEMEVFAEALRQHFDLIIRLENVAPQLAESDAEPKHHCDKPDCGRSAGGSGCTSCGTGGCSSCGTGKVDMREYFA